MDIYITNSLSVHSSQRTAVSATSRPLFYFNLLFCAVRARRSPFLFLVILRLSLPEGLILALRLHQSVVSALLHHLPVVKHGDLVAETAGG